jgi:hypothetical protein
LTELVLNDTESEERFSKANDENEQKMFEFSERDLTTDTNENETEINNHEEFDTQTSKNNDLSSCQLASRVNMFIDKNLSKAENRLKNAKKKIGVKELEKKGNIQCRLRICINNEFDVTKRTGFHGL